MRTMDPRAYLMVLYRPYYKRSFIKTHRQDLDQKTLEELRTLGYIR